MVNEKKVAVFTLGCKLNQCESEALASAFESQGFIIVPSKEYANIYIINTCTVTSKAEQKARRMIRKLSSEHSESVVIVTGCYAQLNKEDLQLNTNVFIVTNDEKQILSELPQYLQKKNTYEFLDQIQKFFSINQNKINKSFWFETINYNYHTRAFLKIQDGCNNSCAYCRVTIARGDSISLDSEKIIDQYLSLYKNGFKEIVLTGINISSYSYNNLDFCDLLNRLIEVSKKYKDAPRIRLSSIEPETINERFVNIVKNKLFCPHFHVPLQSGSDKILSLMKRRNDRLQAEKAINLLIESKEYPFIAVDVIAGFPGETNEDFELTKNLLNDLRIDFFHVFPFSPRPGTLAEKMKPKIPERISQERTKILRDLSYRKYKDYINYWINKKLNVLIEDNKDGYYTGTSENYLKCCIYDQSVRVGNIYKVIVTNVMNEHLVCKLV